MITTVAQGVGKSEPLHVVYDNFKLRSPFDRIHHFFKRLNMVLAYDQLILYSGIYQREMETYIRKKIGTQKLIASLFIIAKNVEII